MKSHQLKNEDLVKKADEFSKTPFGHRAKAFSLIPFCLSALCFLIFIILDFVGEVQIIAAISALGCIVSFSIGCIAQLQYGNMLKDYIESNK